MQLTIVVHEHFSQLDKLRVTFGNLPAHCFFYFRCENDLKKEENKKKTKVKSRLNLNDPEVQNILDQAITWRKKVLVKELRDSAVFHNSITETIRKHPGKFPAHI